MTPDPSPSEDALVAFRNAFKLGGSLLFTWAVAFGIRILLPRHLGPAAFGYLNFADAFTVTSFVLLALGVDTYIRKEAPVRPELASEIFGGVLLIRLAVAVVLFVASASVIRALGRSPLVAQLVLVFAIGQLFMSVSATIAAILHATGNVDGLSVVNGGAKLLWGAGVLLAIAFHHALMGAAVAFALSEAAKAVALYLLAREHASLRLRLDLGATKAAVVASLPFYLNHVAMTAYGRIDVTVLSFAIRDEKELGWYGAGSNLAGLCLLVTPIIGWVLMPLLARAAARDGEELRRTLARSMEIVLTIAIPTSLVVILGADLWIRLLFGPAFAPAALPLRILGAMFVLTYVATVSGTCLAVLGRGWVVTGVSFVGLFVTVLLNVTFVRIAATRLGHVAGAAGAGAALALLLSETLVTIALTLLLGRTTFDRRSVSLLSRTLAAAAAVAVVDRLASPLGSVRLALDVACYVALVLAFRALRWREMVQFSRAAFHRADADLA